jgi:hypothetical protein
MTRIGMNFFGARETGHARKIKRIVFLKHSTYAKEAR